MYPFFPSQTAEESYLPTNLPPAAGLTKEHFVETNRVFAKSHTFMIKVRNFYDKSSTFMIKVSQSPEATYVPVISIYI